MTPGWLISQLERSRDTLRCLLSGLAPKDVRWKPAPDKWSILEVIGHLADEEVEDFRTRLDLTLHHHGQTWPPIDPVGWVAERAYAAQDFEATLHRFLAERERSVAWLRTLESPDWELVYEHPAAGPIRAGDLALSWAAHDLLHVRQITRLLFQELEGDGRPYSSAYAGEW